MAPKRGGGGSLSERVIFQKRAAAPAEEPDYGNPIVGPWTDQFSEPCRLVPKLGGEPVLGQRLVKRQPYVMTVRCSARTRGVAMDWRAVNARSGAIYNLTTSVNTDERGAYLDLLVIEGDAS